jgi:hypothetical protein
VPLDQHPELARLLAVIGRQGHADSLDMLALADALEEAGCTERNLLNHCRAARSHGPACWVIERLKGRELLRLSIDEKVTRPHVRRR